MTSSIPPAITNPLPPTPLVSPVPAASPLMGMTPQPPDPATWTANDSFALQNPKKDDKDQQNQGTQPVDVPGMLHRSADDFLRVRV